MHTWPCRSTAAPAVANCSPPPLVLLPPLSIVLLIALATTSALAQPWSHQIVIDSTQTVSISTGIDDHQHAVVVSMMSTNSAGSTVSSVRSHHQRPTIAGYLSQRQLLLDTEQDVCFESDQPPLTDREQLANRVVMAAKKALLDSGFLSPKTFAPAQHFFRAKRAIRATKLFKILHRMPKGAVLHAHDTAMASADFIVSLTYRKNLWQRNNQSSGQIAEFRFARQAPAEGWTLTADERQRQGAAVFDAFVRGQMSLVVDNPAEAYADVDEVWERFMQIFALVGPLVTYVPVWCDYYRQALTEMLADNVQYLEFRGLLPQLYDLDGGKYAEVDVVQMYVDVLAQFRRENPTFIGSKMVYAPLKFVSNADFGAYVSNITTLHAMFPDFVAGFDLVGQEDKGRALVDLAPLLLQLPEEIRFFFHAGETNWFGSVDENVLDAILLGTLRIGHGYALAKHPKLVELVKERDIAVEINPLSNQVLKLVDDLRNHPAAIYFAQNVPVVVSSDDPCFWDAAPLSDDFFAAFLGIASSQADLRTLKKLATNSIKYSALNDAEKAEAFAKWQTSWDAFIELVIADKF